MNRKKRKTEIGLICKVLLGMFSDERGVLIELPSGRKVSAIVDKSKVITREILKPDREVDGYVKVSVVEMSKNSAVVDLPQSGLTNGTRVNVPKKMLLPV